MNKRILEIIKKKADEATMEELDEALQYIENKIKGFGIVLKSEQEDKT